MPSRDGPPPHSVPSVPALLREAGRVDGVQAVGVVADAVLALAALPGPARLAVARALQLDNHARALGGALVPLLRAIVDDEVLRPFVVDDAVLAWLDVDAEGAIAHALPHLAALAAATVVRMLALVDEGEAFDLLAPVFEEDADARERIVAAPIEARGTFADARWIDVAMRLLHKDAIGACHVLRMNASKRADEELDGIVAHAVALDGVVVAALGALEQGAPFRNRDDVRSIFVNALARFLAIDGSEGIELSRLALSVSVASRQLRVHPLVVASDGAHRRIIACQRAHPHGNDWA